MTPLQKAAQAILDYWDAPASLAQLLNSEHIYEKLRGALEDETAQETELVAWLRHDRFKAMTDDEKSSWIESGNGDVVDEYTIPLYTGAEVPDMFWNQDDSEQCHYGIGEFLNDEVCNGFLEVGTEFTLLQAKSMPKIRIRVTSINEDECEAEYEIIEGENNDG